MRSHFAFAAVFMAISFHAAPARTDGQIHYVHSFATHYGRNANTAPGGAFPGPLTGHQTGSDPSTWALYGVTASGGDNDNGLAFTLSPPAPGVTQWTERRLFSFPTNLTPGGPVRVDARGSVYGVTDCYGDYRGCRTIYQLSPNPGYFYALHFRQDLGIIYYLPDFALDATGVIYGIGTDVTTFSPVLYRVVPPAPGTTWKLSVLSSVFSTFVDPGRYSIPDTPIVLGPGGEVYGVASGLCEPPNNGDNFVTCPAIVFRVRPPLSGAISWTFDVLYSFSRTFPASYGADGTVPTSLLLDVSGTLFVAVSTLRGYGLPTDGSVYALRPPASDSGAWTATDLYDFKGTDGYNLTSLVRFDPAGPIFGTTASHAPTAAMPGRGGVVFRLDPPTVAGGTWRESTVGVVPTYGMNSDYLQGPLVRDPSGRLFTSDQYGTPPFAENLLDQGGTVLQITP